MIIKTKVQNYCPDLPPEMMGIHHPNWAKMSVNLRNVVAIGEVMWEGKLLKGVSQIMLNGLGSWVILMDYSKLEMVWEESNPELILCAN